MKENQILKFIKDKLDCYYLKADYSIQQVGHVFITEGLHIIVNDDKEECKWVELNSFDKEPKIRKVCKDEETLTKELDKALLAVYKIKHERIQKDYEQRCCQVKTPFLTHLIIKSAYYVWLFAFDQATKRFKKGKETAGIWTPIRHAVYPIWKRASYEELNKIFNDYKEKQKKSK